MGYNRYIEINRGNQKMEKLIISDSGKYFDIMIYQGMILLPKEDIPMILEEWGYSEIIEDFMGNKMISFWENDYLIFQNNWGKRISFSYEEFKNRFLLR